MGRANVPHGLSLLLSLPVASGFLLGSALFGVTEGAIGVKELGLPSSISRVQDPHGPALLLRIRVDSRDIFGEPDMKGAAREHGVGRR